MSAWRQLTLLLLIPLFLHACAKPEGDDAIRMGLASAPITLDPRYATDATSDRINRLLYQRLIGFDEQSMPMPGIADWQRLSAHHYRFRLNSKAGRFSHGPSLAADDVIATYRHVLDKNNASPKRSALTLIESLSKVDDETVDFKLSRADPLFPAYLTLEILPADLIAENHDFA
ncbi:MAG: ABC transporter substrate-binding protein, partial [Candidatus Thiodiazotropha sp.]